MMSQQPITIVGAGLAGLVLGRSLANHGRRSILYQRGQPGPRFAYGITLYPSTYRPLMNMLGIDDITFRRRLAIDAELGGIGRVSADEAEGTDASSFRASRQKLEQLLKEGLDIKYDHQLTSAETSPQGVKLCFEGKDPVVTPYIVDASGIHSKLRYSLSKEKEPKVLPFVVLNGKRRVPTAKYNEVYAPHFRDVTTLEHRLGNGTVIAMSIAECKDDLVNLSYTYSRPARNDDELYKPARAMTGAEDIPEAFHTELNDLVGLKEPFASMFDPATAKNDRVLHWLMRTTMVSLPELQRLAKVGVCMIGDASHGHPIVGGEGANVAMMDGLELADWIATNGIDDLETFLANRREVRKDEVQRSEKALEDMHSTQSRRGGHSL